MYSLQNVVCIDFKENTLLVLVDQMADVFECLLYYAPKNTEPASALVDVCW